MVDSLMTYSETVLTPLDRVRGALVGLAVGDALGAPVEFKDRETFPAVRDMQAGGYFRLPAGAWTDDTAMALCLADSLLHDGDLDRPDLLDRFLRWMDEHENTSTGKCIGVGQNTLVVMGNYRRTGALVAPPVRGRSDGNGALMRVAPIACLHWQDIPKARMVARLQSFATHASELSAAACEALAWLLCELIAGRSWDDAFGRIASGNWPNEIQAIISGTWAGKPRDEILSTGYVVHTLEAAIWAVGSTASFEDALILAVNLGHDADTVGAVTGQIAGARYGNCSIPSRWNDALAMQYDIDRRAQELFAVSIEQA